VTCDRRHEPNPEHKRKEHSLNDRIHAGAKHDQCEQTRETDITDVLQE
jgi:hypothetical protein